MSMELGGHTRIKNEVLEDLALAGPVLGVHDWAIIVLVMRDSWGWDAGSSNWSHSAWWPAKFALWTGFHRERLSKALAAMIQDNVLHAREGEDGLHLAVNEHTLTWTGAHQVAMDHRYRDELSQKEPLRKRPAYMRDKLSRDEMSHLQGDEESPDKRRDKLSRTPVCDKLSHQTSPKPKRGKASRDPKEIRSLSSKDQDLKEGDEMAFSPDALAAAAHLKDGLKAQGATHLPADFHLKAAAVAERILKHVALDELNRCIDDLLKDEFITVTNMNKIEDYIGAWQASQSKGGWRAFRARKGGRSGAGSTAARASVQGVVIIDDENLGKAMPGVRRTENS